MKEDKPVSVFSAAFSTPPAVTPLTKGLLTHNCCSINHVHSYANMHLRSARLRLPQISFFQILFPRGLSSIDYWIFCSIEKGNWGSGLYRLKCIYVCYVAANVVLQYNLSCTCFVYTALHYIWFVHTLLSNFRLVVHIPLKELLIPGELKFKNPPVPTFVQVRGGTP